MTVQPRRQSGLGSDARRYPLSVSAQRRRATSDELSDEALARKDAVERSWKAAQQALADPTFREQLDESIERVNRSTAPLLTRDEFLAQTTPATE